MAVLMLVLAVILIFAWLGDGGPVLNAATDGKSWEEHGIRLSQVLGRNRNTAEGSGQLWEYAYQKFIAPNVEKGRLAKDTGTQKE